MLTSVTGMWDFYVVTALSHFSGEYFFNQAYSYDEKHIQEKAQIHI